jgi:hypothetical protein
MNGFGDCQYARCEFPLLFVLGLRLALGFKCFGSA